MVVRVSVVILNLNGARFVQDLILSLSGQTFQDFEVVFVDNASTDDSVKILHDLLEMNEFREMRVQIIVNNSNLGYCAGNNIGLAHANGDYIVFLNNDTFVDPKWLEKLVEVLDGDQSVGACQSMILFAQSKKIQCAGLQLDFYGWNFPIINKETTDVTTTGFFYCMGTSVIVRRSIMIKCGGFDEIIFSGDYDLAWAIRLYGYKIAVSNKSICYHYGSYSTRTLFARPKQTSARLVSPKPIVELPSLDASGIAEFIFYEACKERVYVLLKNYSFSKTVVRIPVSMVLMLSAAIVWSQRTRRDYLTSLSKALIWNLKTFRKLMIKRGKIQRDRKVQDCEIEQFMSKYPFMILFYRSVLLKE